MKMQKVYLEYLPEYETYGISDEKIKQLTEAGITPILEFNPLDAQKLSEKQKNNEKQPTVALFNGIRKTLPLLVMKKCKEFTIGWLIGLKNIIKINKQKILSIIKLKTLCVDKVDKYE